MTQNLNLTLATDSINTDAKNIGVSVDCLEQIEVCVSVDIIQKPEPSLLLHFRIRLFDDTLADQLDWPDWQPQNVSSQDYLWERTCLECFIKGTPLNQDQTNRYIEINVSPSGHYAFYKFESYRNPATLPPIPLLKRDTTSGHADIIWHETNMMNAINNTGTYQRKFAIPLAQLPQDIFDYQSLTIERFNLSVILYFASTPLYFAPGYLTPPDFHDQRYWLDFNNC